MLALACSCYYFTTHCYMEKKRVIWKEKLCMNHAKWIGNSLH